MSTTLLVQISLLQWGKCLYSLNYSVYVDVEVEMYYGASDDMILDEWKEVQSCSW